MEKNILNQILETTLYTPSQRRPAAANDISRNVTTHFWRDISNSTDQTLDPITQEDFQPDDRVSRIDYCGHLFMEDALNTYLTDVKVPASIAATTGTITIFFLTHSNLDNLFFLFICTYWFARTTPTFITFTTLMICFYAMT